jgi:hypothetical protein
LAAALLQVLLLFRHSVDSAALSAGSLVMVVVFRRPLDHCR